MKKSIQMMLGRSILLLAIVLLFPMAAYAQAPTEAEAYNKMIALKADYPEGTQWNNDNFYQWKGGIYSGGYGCAGFAFMLSDAAFDDLSARKYTSIDYDALKVGDILRDGGNTHSMIILQKFDDNVVIAEGNYNNSVHWGRVLSKNTVLSSSYYITRYPESDSSSGEPSDKTQPVTVKCSKKSIKASILKKKAIIVQPLSVSGAEGDVEFKIIGGKAKARKVLKINDKTGKVTVKKKTAKGTYTVKVMISVAGTDEHEPFSKTVSVTIKVK